MKKKKKKMETSEKKKKMETNEKKKKMQILKKTAVKARLPR